MRGVLLWAIGVPLIPAYTLLSMRITDGPDFMELNFGGEFAIMLMPLIVALGLVAAFVPAAVAVCLMSRKPAFWRFAFWAVFGYSASIVALALLNGMPIIELLVMGGWMVAGGVIVAPRELGISLLGFMGFRPAPLLLGVLSLLPLLTAFGFGYYRMEQHQDTMRA